MGQLAERIAHLTTRYGSDASAWQHEIHALAALEGVEPRRALDAFYALKRRLVEFRRAQLLRELREKPFVRDVPSPDATGYPLQELEADIRAATRALRHARAVEQALEEEREARASLKRRILPPAEPLAPAAWDALGPLAEEAESRRRLAMREARLDRRAGAAHARAARLTLARVAPPDPALDADALDAALDEAERALDAAEALEDAHAKAVAPLRAPEVRSFRDSSRRALEAEAKALADSRDVDALRRFVARAEALRQEAAALASQAARSRRAGKAPPERERSHRDGVDPYG